MGIISCGFLDAMNGLDRMWLGLVVCIDALYLVPNSFQYITCVDHHPVVKLLLAAASSSSLPSPTTPPLSFAALPHVARLVTSNYSLLVLVSSP